MVTASTGLKTFSELRPEKGIMLPVLAQPMGRHDNGEIRWGWEGGGGRGNKKRSGGEGAEEGMREET